MSNFLANGISLLLPWLRCTLGGLLDGFAFLIFFSANSSMNGEGSIP